MAVLHLDNRLLYILSLRFELPENGLGLLAKSNVNSHDDSAEFELRLFGRTTETKLGVIL